MRRTLFFIIGGLLLGGIIHIAIVFLVPHYAGRDAWTQMAAFGRDNQFHVLDLSRAGSEPLALLDPRMLHAVCRFSLDDAPVHITATWREEFWSVAIFDRRGRNIYSLNDRSADRTHLDLAVITPVQMAQLRRDPPAALDTAIVVELPLTEGFALLRMFVPDETALASTREALQTADCSAPL